MLTRHQPDGSILLRAAESLQPFEPALWNAFRAQAERQPEKSLYAQRQRNADGGSGDWQHVSFAEGLRQAEAIGQWLLDRGLERGDVLLVLSGNSIAHAVLRWGALAAGLCACPVSVNYALLGGDYARLRHVVKRVKPKAVFAETGGAYAAGVRACMPEGATVISRHPEAFGPGAVNYESLLETAPGEAIRQRIGSCDPDGHAAYMLTSGSTGLPKVVVQTQRMLATNLHQAFQVLGAASGWDEVMLDWLPWSHVSGAFGMLAAAVFGGTLYIDEGKPLPGMFEESLRNLREIAVPYYGNVPAGFAALTGALETDAELRRTFFSRLRMLLYGGAGLPQPLLNRLQALAVRETGRRIFMTSGYGATETASGCMGIYWDTDKVGIGLPMPGLEAKLVPCGGHFELRLRGDNITPGYLDDPASTAAAFDEEGFYRTGDAVRFHDDKDTAQGLYFAGRLVEEFKLDTGTWVYAGSVRGAVLNALAPALADLLLCGSGRDYLAVLGVPNPAGLQQIAELPGTPEPAQLLASDRVRAFLRTALRTYNEANPGSSQRIKRFAFLATPPDAARNELSDKGTLNQLGMMQNRAAEIDALYASEPGPQILVVHDD